jgi:hypothetical protein
MKVGNFLEWERKMGGPIYEGGGRVIRPISRVLSVWWQPYGGGVWNWPVAVRVEENGSVHEVPIINVNLLAQLSIGLMTMIVGMVISGAVKRRSTK